MLRSVAALESVLNSAALALPNWPTSIFSWVSTPAQEVNRLSIFVLTITAGIYLGVSGLLIYALVKFRARTDDTTEPPQVFGSTQIELAWTIIPILFIIVLFLGTARIIFAVQDAPKPASALDVVVIGHQFWWEFRYPEYNIATANELHVPLSPVNSPKPTFLKLTSADVMHSFWVPRLSGKTDVVPNRVNEMWVDPHQPGLYLGQCAQFCGPEHAKMLLRVYVDTPDEFQRWVSSQRNPEESGTAPIIEKEPQRIPENAVGTAPPPTRSSAEGKPAEASGSSSSDDINAEQGRRVFEQQACINCHTISGTVADGRYGPDLTHLMSRATIGAGIAPNTAANLKAWVADPNTIKPGTLMPAMHLTERQNDQLVAYLTTLR